MDGDVDEMLPSPLEGDFGPIKRQNIRKTSRAGVFQVTSEAL